MKKTVLFTGLLFTGFSALAQISTLPYSQSFDNTFTTGTNVKFLPDWTGNEVQASARIFRETTDFDTTPAALAIIPTGSFNGEVIVDLDLTSYSNVAVEFKAKSMANGTGSRPTKLEMATSTDNGTTWSTPVLINEFPHQNQTSFSTHTYYLPASANQAANVKVRFSATEGSTGSGTRAKLVIDDVKIEVNTNPTLTVTPSGLTFDQILGAPSKAQAVTVTAINLTANIDLTVTAPFEVALTENGTYAATQTLTLTNGGYSGDVYVRLNNATQDNSITGTLTAQTAGITPDPVVNLDGTADDSQVTHPAPFDLSTGNYTFDQWDETSAAGIYPDNMIFWINDAGDGVESTDADWYFYDWECVYDSGSQSRILGEGVDGVSFLNTGNTITEENCYNDPALSGRLSGKPGAAVLALNTLDRENIQIDWTGRTIEPNNRVYALKLQYRIGDGNGNPNIDWQDFATVSEYTAETTAGDFQNLSAVLPSSAEDQALVQLRWIYFEHNTNTATGSRARLALDDITVTSAKLNTKEFEKNSLVMYPNPSSDIVNFDTETTGVIYDLNGKKVLSFENTASVNISQLTKGVYVVKTNEGATTKLVVK